MFRSKYPQHLKLDNEMNEIIGDFIDYLLNTKNYSTHTATAYESDLRDFTEFYERWSNTKLLPADLSHIDTICFRAWLADRAKRNLTHKSTARALSSIRTFYKYIAKKHDIQNDAIGLISAPRVPRKLSKAIETTEVAEMKSALVTIDDKNPWVATRDWALIMVLMRLQNIWMHAHILATQANHCFAASKAYPCHHAWRKKRLKTCAHIYSCPIM